MEGVVRASDTGKPLAGVLVDVTPMDRHGGEPVGGRAVVGLDLIEVLLFFQVGHPVRDAVQLGIQLGDLQ